MKRYIDTDSFFADFPKLTVYKFLFQAYGADVVEVVHCKDCKHSYYDKELEKYWCTNYSVNIEKSADGFCDDGKPRSE